VGGIDGVIQRLLMTNTYTTAATGKTI